MKLLVFASLLSVCAAYKMVILAPDISKSQVTFNSRVAQCLAEAGHDVTLVLIATFPDMDNSAVKIDKRIRIHRVNSSTEIKTTKLEEMQKDAIFKDVSLLDPKQKEFMDKFMGSLIDTCRNTIRNKEFLKWLENEKFDLAFAHMYSSCPIGIIHVAKIPTWIWLNSGMLMDNVASAVGVPLIPSYVPPMIMATDDRLCFFERIKSFIGHGLVQAFWPRMVANKETKIFREEIDPNFPDLIDLAGKCPLVMVNSNELYELPRPTLAKVISIGGIGAQEKDAKPLTKEFADMVSKGKGVVLFSFGSVAAAHNMPESWKTAFLAAFARLPEYQFIVRYEKTDLDDRVPANVHLRKWLPQTDLLQHNATKAFITHGGYNSLQEAITAGKPMINIALFGDQPKNAKIAKKHGIALELQKADITEDKLYDALQEILTNEQYSLKASRMREMVRRRPVSADHLLVRWAEFAAEFRSLENLEPAGVHLSFIQYHSIDVMLTLAAILFILFYTVYKLIKAVVRCIFCKGNTKDKKD